MSELRVYAEDNPKDARTWTDGDEIAAQLKPIGVLFERWEAGVPLERKAPEADVLAAYRGPVARLMAKYGFQSADVVALTPDHPNKVALRNKFLNEHTHSEDEVRFFVSGRGLFYLHAAGKVFAVLCEKGDLISVPAGTTHWFDMGPNPEFQCIRLFISPEGWVASFTGSDIASRFLPLGG